MGKRSLAWGQGNKELAQDLSGSLGAAQIEARKGGYCLLVTGRSEGSMFSLPLTVE